MASETQIANLALYHLGISRQITNLATENSAEAKVCRKFYETTKDSVLRAFNWPFATAFATLALVEEDPTDEWGYSYRYPSDCLKFRRILSGSRVDNQRTAIPYRIARDSTGKLIYTDQDEAEGEYTMKITDAGQFDSEFVIALSWLLASYIAPGVSGGDPYKLGERAMKMYFSFELPLAQASALHEEREEEPPESEFMSARE